MTFGRIAIAIIVAFVLFHVVIFWRYGHDRIIDGSTEFAINTLERGNQAAQVLSADPELLPLLSSPSFKLRYVAEPGRERSRWRHAASIRQRVADHLEKSDTQTPTGAAAVFDFTELRGRPTLLAWIPLSPAPAGRPDSTRWLEVTARPTLSRQSERLRSATGTTLLLLAVLGSLLWATRRITRHLPRFADAAEALARGERLALPESGPKDVRRLARSFNAMSSQIQQTAADRTQMLGALGHDLRTAITRLVLRTEGIAEAEQRSAAQRDLDDMASLLEQSMTFARDEHASEAWDQTDVASLLQTAVDDAAETGGDVTYHGPDRLVATVQPLGLRRAVDNLISNAIRYGTRARVRVRADDALQIRVSDDGPGIPAADRERVTQAFYRLEPSRNRDHGGAGLGLAIVAGVVRRHGGELSFEDDDGFTVTMTLPVRRQL